MPNKNYVNGRRKEYKIVHQLKDEGFDISVRTAGSHSPIDVIAINSQTKEIKLVQSKSKNFSDKESKKLYEQNKLLNGMFMVSFEVI